MLGTLDANIWGILAMPVGLIFCFGPALLLWAKTEFGNSPDDRKDGPR